MFVFVLFSGDRLASSLFFPHEFPFCLIKVCPLLSCLRRLANFLNSSSNDTKNKNSISSRPELFLRWDYRAKSIILTCIWHFKAPVTELSYVWAHEKKMWNSRAADIPRSQSRARFRIQTGLAANQRTHFHTRGWSCYQSWDNVIHSCFFFFLLHFKTHSRIQGAYNCILHGIHSWTPDKTSSICYFLIPLRLLTR